MCNRVWIEIEHPRGEGHAVGHERAAKLDAMLRKLGHFVGYAGKVVFWHEDKHCYCFTIDTGGSYVEATDNGHWLNLDYLARCEQHSHHVWETDETGLLDTCKICGEGRA